MEDSSLISGVGDEVVLFVLFIVSSVVIILCLSNRRRRRNIDNERLPSNTTATIDSTVIEESTDTVVEDTSAVVEDTGTVVEDAGAEPVEEPFSDAHITDNTVRHRLLQQSSGGQSSDNNASNSSNSNMLSLRLVTLQSTRTISVVESTTLQQLQQNYFANELNERRRIRFIYCGRILANMHSSVADNGITNNSSLHVHIGQRNTASLAPDNNQTGEEENMLDLSSLFLPLIGLLLGIVWMCFLLWPSVFSFPTKFMLFVLSVAYVFMAYSMHVS